MPALIRAIIASRAGAKKLLDVFERAAEKAEQRGLPRKAQDHRDWYDLLWSAVYPVSPNGGEPTGPTGILKCRAGSCENEIQSSGASVTAGYCDPCYEVALGRRPAPVRMPSELEACSPGSPWSG